MTQSSKTRKSTPRPAATRARKLDDATRMAKALSHPVRAKILVRLNEGVASPNEMSQELGEPLGNVSYHVRALLDLDCIELVKTEPRRGALEHYYRAIHRALADEAAWEMLPASVRRSFAGEWFKESFQDARAAVEAGGFDARTDCHLSFTRLNLDERAWRKLSKRMDALLDYALGLQAESAGRLAQGGDDDQVTARLILAQYEGKPGQKRPKRSS